VRVRDEAIRDLVVGLVAVARVIHRIRHEAGRLRLLPPAILAGQQAAAERAIGDDPQAFRLIQREDLHFRLPLDQAVHRLVDGKVGQAMQCGHTQRAGNLPRRPVADAQVEHLARAHEVIERPQRLFHRREGVEGVTEVDIDAVGAEPPQAALDRLLDVPPREAPLVVARTHREADLCRDDQLVALAGHQMAQDFFRAALLVDVRAVKEVDARVPAAPVHGRGGFLIRVAAERHRAEA